MFAHLLLPNCTELLIENALSYQRRFFRYKNTLWNQPRSLWQLMTVIQTGGPAGGRSWVRFGSNNVRIRSKTRVQDAEPT